MKEKDSRKHSRRELARARRICACLNKAIRKNYRISHWQEICINYYELANEKKQEILSG